MPWSVDPPRVGRGWPVAADRAALTARWEAFTGAGDERAQLFGVSRARTLETAVAHLPGQRTGTGRLSRESGPCPQPIRVLHGPFDARWLLPDHRLIDAARPELWRIADAEQVFLVQLPELPVPDGPSLLATRLLPVGPQTPGRGARVRPLYRRPGGREPNLAPGLTAHLTDRLGVAVSAEDVAAWILASARPGRRVPLTADPARWARGVAAGRRLRALQCGDGERPRLPGGRRPFVRAALGGWPGGIAYVPQEGTLLLGDARIAPVAPEAWEFRVGGLRVLEQWFAGRAQRGEPGTLEAIGPRAWPQRWTSELLDLVTVLALLAEAEVEVAAARESAEDGPVVGAPELRAAGVLPVPAAARRPASVLDHQEDGPDGQLSLV
ncbi:type ISP restriction/modification enzyme [Streptomyces sp. NPDC060194]|uniref:type ISP restriction/modification enzyme n=1 Tax=Streptomyces sp. NPDC060194 TaxID=3347069 RepID=UPI0036554C38